MFRPVGLFIGWRYAFARRRNGFLSFLSVSAVVGLALGVGILITVMSVMNGFTHDMKQRLGLLSDQVVIESLNSSGWHRAEQVASTVPGVVAVNFYQDAQVLFAHSGIMLPLVLRGIDASKRVPLTISRQHLDYGRELSGSKLFTVVLTQSLARRLGVVVRDKITVVLPKQRASILGVMPTFRRFEVVGIYSFPKGSDPELAIQAYTDLASLNRLLDQPPDKVSGLRLWLHNPLQALAIAKTVSSKLGDGYWVKNWTEQYGSFFEAIAMQKTMLFLVLLLIVLIASFTLVSSLVMMALYKRKEIAILRTMGITTFQVILIFTSQGMFMALLGMALGVGLGVFLSLHAGDIVRLLEHYIHHNLVKETFIYIDYLPSKIDLNDIWVVITSATIISVMATWYPAYTAARIKPVTVLKGQA